MWDLDNKKAESWRIDASEPWCWRRLLRVPWTARRSKQSILKEISTECSLEGLMLRLKFQYFGISILRNSNTLHLLMRRTDSLKDPYGGKDWRWEEKGTTEDEMVGWHHRLNEHESEQTPGDSGGGQGSLVSILSKLAVHLVTKSWTWLSNWTTTNL